VDSTVFAPSIVYSPGDPWITLLDRLTRLPVAPVSGAGDALYQPIWADDVADCVVGALRNSNGQRRYELAGPEALTYDGIVKTALRAFGRRRRLLHVPLPVVRASLAVAGAFAGPSVFATWDEAELMELSMTTPTGTADAESLGVKPLPMGAVLGAR
jgi:NADH dehydrogenase